VLNVRISLLIAAFVATVVSGTNLLHAQGQPAGRPVARPTAPKSGTNVAVVDVGFIFKNAERFKRAMDDLKAADTKFQNEVTTRRDAINAQIQKLQNMSKATTDYKILE